MRVRIDRSDPNASSSASVDFFKFFSGQAEIDKRKELSDFLDDILVKAGKDEASLERESQRAIVLIKTLASEASDPETFNLIAKAQNFVNNSQTYLEKARHPSRPHHSAGHRTHSASHAGRPGGAMGYHEEDEDAMSLMHGEGMCEECDAIRREESIEYGRLGNQMMPTPEQAAGLTATRLTDEEQFGTGDTTAMPDTPSPATGTAVLREKGHSLPATGKDRLEWAITHREKMERLRQRAVAVGIDPTPYLGPSTAQKFYKIGGSASRNSTYITKSADGRHHYIHGIVSDDSVDRDGDRMSLQALKQMEGAINSGLTLFEDHKHDIENSLGHPVHAEIKNADGTNQLWATFKLEDPERNPLVASLLSKIDSGQRVGFSIGGDMDEKAGVSREWNGVRTINGVKLYEVSAVGLPSNANAFVMGHFLKNWS